MKVKYIGIQDTTGSNKPPFPLINIDEQTVMYVPEKHGKYFDIETRNLIGRELSTALFNWRSSC